MKSQHGLIDKKIIEEAVQEALDKRSLFETQELDKAKREAAFYKDVIDALIDENELCGSRLLDLMYYYRTDDLMNWNSPGHPIRDFLITRRVNYPKAKTAVNKKKE